MPPKDIYVARKLIKQKRYSEARDILVMLDHPTADRWLEKLDEIAPIHSNSQNRFPLFSLSLMAIVVAITTVIFITIPRLDFGVIVIFLMVCGLAMVNSYLQLSDYSEQQHG